MQREGESPKPGFLGLPLLVGAVGAVGLGFAAAAATTLAQSPPSLETWLGIAVLLAAALLAERFPVPISGVNAGAVSLAAVFIVAAGYLDGWALALLVACAARGFVEVTQHRPLKKVIYNCSTYGLAAAAAGFAARLAPHTANVAWLVADTFVGSTAFYVVNVVLIAFVIACAARKPLRWVLSQTVRSTALAFAIMFSVCLMLDGLWQRSPVLSATLLGPLLAIGLYQRSADRERKAIELALTDPLTGLGNYRHFQARLEHVLDDADLNGSQVSLAVLDLDDFKRINDGYGHPTGDRVLAAVGECIRRGGEGFRLGGDEFALLLPGCAEQEALNVVSRVFIRFTKNQPDTSLATTVSAGVATYPANGLERGQLVRAADRALYTAKASGRNAVRAYRPDVIELSERRISDEADRRARLNAASCLARTIQVRDAYTGDHSEAVADLAARLGLHLGLSAEQAELIRLAGRVHDLGKLAIAEDVLCKPGVLSVEERRTIETHSEIGFRMLASLGIEPVATWVLHHHERWDGTGYPNGLQGDEIPLGSRILMVADAYEAMTSDRVYRERMPAEAAIAELEGGSGHQFDPAVVDALIELVAAPRLPARAALRIA
jgi:diguanylate cyclase (GGDEF)-like protein